MTVTRPLVERASQANNRAHRWMALQQVLYRFDDGPHSEQEAPHMVKHALIV